MTSVDLVVATLRAEPADVDDVLTAVSAFIAKAPGRDIVILYRALLDEATSEPVPGDIHRQNAAFALVVLLGNERLAALPADGLLRLDEALRREEDRDVQAQLVQACALMLKRGAAVANADSLEELLRSLAIGGASSHCRHAAQAAIAFLPQTATSVRSEGKEKVRGVGGLHTHSERARKKVAQCDQLDVEGIIVWLKRYSQLEKLWIVAPNFLDDENQSVFNADLGYLRRDVDVTYFVAASDCGRSGRFSKLRRKLVQTAGKSAKAHLHTVPLPEDAVTFLRTDHVIANPHLWEKQAAVGWQYLRRDGKPWVAFLMDTPDLNIMIGRIENWWENAKSKRSRDRSQPRAMIDPAVAKSEPPKLILLNA